jgi:hypothetical protein
MVLRAPQGSGMGTPDRVGRLPPHTRPAAGSTCVMVGRKLRQRHESAVGYWPKVWRKFALIS